MTNPYTKYILPTLTEFLCACKPIMKQREKVVPLAFGRVLEIGAGSGLNFKYYSPIKVKHIFALDPSKELLRIAQKNITTNQPNTEFIQGFAEAIPLQNHTIDTVLITYSMCTIKDLITSLEEMKRVLKPSGQLIFCEHGMAPEVSVRRWQNLLNPIWRRLGGGCNLNRDIPKILESSGFLIEKLETMYLPGFKPACFNYWGVAKPRIKE